MVRFTSQASKQGCTMRSRVHQLLPFLCVPIKSFFKDLSAAVLRFGDGGLVAPCTTHLTWACARVHANLRQVARPWPTPCRIAGKQGQGLGS